MNKVILTGRITRKPELKDVRDKKVCEFSLATNRPVIRDGEKAADFVNCVVWGTQAENLYKYQDKGSLIAVFGELRVDNYEDKEGNKRQKTYVLVSNVEFLGSKKKEEKDPFEEFGESITTKSRLEEQLTITDQDLPF